MLVVLLLLVVDDNRILIIDLRIIIIGTTSIVDVVPIDHAVRWICVRKIIIQLVDKLLVVLLHVPAKLTVISVIIQ